MKGGSDKAADDSLYAVLGLERRCSEKEIVRAFRILARKYHPDKAGQESTQRFQCIRDAYEVLSDPEKRAHYDVFGMVGENILDRAGGLGQTFEPKVEAEDILRFAEEYPGSAEEKSDVLDFFFKHSGKIDDIFDCVPLAEESQACLDRFMAYVEEALASPSAASAPQEQKKIQEAFEVSQRVLKNRVRTAQRRRQKENKRFKEEYGKETTFEELAAQIKRNREERKSQFGDLLMRLENMSSRSGSRSRSRSRGKSEVKSDRTASKPEKVERGEASDGANAEKVKSEQKKVKKTNGEKVKGNQRRVKKEMDGMPSATDTKTNKTVKTPAKRRGNASRR